MAKEKKEPKKGEEVAAEETKVATPVTPGGFKRIKVTAEQLAKLQEEKKLVGYDPAKQEAILNA